MKNNLQLHLAVVALIILVSACKKPTACIEVPPRLAPKAAFEFVSCSENFEFQTWEFGDESYGQIGDSLERQFDNEGRYTIQLTAYAKGGYTSDATSKDLIVSHRYIKKIEIIGDLNFDYVRFYRTGSVFYTLLQVDARGTFTEANPWTYTPTDRFTSQLLDETNIAFAGEINGVEVETFFRSDYKLDKYGDTDVSPLVLENNGYTVKIYWEFKTFE